MSLLEEPENKSISIEDAGKALGVSTATVRNWIKTGYLQKTSKSLVSKESVDTFEREVAGGDKLVSRANKSLKDSHNHDALKHDFLSLLKNSNDIGSQTGEQYENLLSNAYRNKEGIYYTPNDVVNFFEEFIQEGAEKKTFCDPCCGSGNFIAMALRKGILPENIYGFDIDPVAVEITKRRIMDMTGYVSNNIVCCDFLHESINSTKKYDYIFTNPPWGKKIRLDEKVKLGRLFGAGKSLDTSSLFYFSCMSQLEEKGILGFLLPDAFFNVATFSDARINVLQHKIMALKDFGKPFKGLLTKAKGVVLENSDSNAQHSIRCHTSVVGERKQSSFLDNPKAIINISCDESSAQVISHIYSKSHVTLAGAARYGLGIVTGNNKRYVSDKPKAGYIPVFRGADIEKSGLKSASAFIPSNLSLYQQVAPEALFLAKEKLMYKFISSELVFYHDTKQSYCLNSANMIVLNEEFPISGKQLAELLNSELMNWLFKSIFETYKILKSDIEALPIHADYYTDNSVFVEEKYLKYLGIEKRDNGTYRVTA